MFTEREQRLKRLDSATGADRAAELSVSGLGRCGLGVLVLLTPLACGSPESQAERPGSPSSAGRSDPAPASAAAHRSPFSDITAEVGIDFRYENGMSGQMYFLEMMNAGGAFLDYDGDGDLDVYLAQGYPLEPGRTASSDSFLDRLYRNDLEVGPDGSRTLHFTDVTEESGIRGIGYGLGAATGDYDNDGWVDLYVLNWGRNQLWRNNGDGTFTDATDSGVGDAGWSAGASFVDFDLDGWLDLMVVNYSSYTLEGDRPCYAESGRRDYCGPLSYLKEQDRLYRNLGDGSFEDVTLKMELSGSVGAALGVVAADFNLDGWPDIYVTIDREENHLWINQGGRRFQEAGVLAGAAVNAAGMPEASMGIVAEDFNNDGQVDLFMTHLKGETNTLFLNQGGALFEDRTRLSSLGAASRVHTGFGIAPFDYDNDGWLDLFIANGAVTILPEQADRGDPLPLKQVNQLFRNLGDGRFRDATPQNDPVFQLEEVSRGVALGDVDNDGDSDIVVANNDGPVRLLRNEVGQENRWLGLRLLVAPGGRDAYGTRVALVQSGETILWRRVHTDGSFSSAHDPRVLFGLGDRPAPEAVRVHWPGGAVEVWQGLAPGRYHTLVRGEGETIEAQ